MVISSGLNFDGVYTWGEQSSRELGDSGHLYPTLVCGQWQPPLETETRGHVPCKKVGFSLWWWKNRVKKKMLKPFFSVEWWIQRVWWKGERVWREGLRVAGAGEGSSKDERIPDTCVGIE